MTDNEERIQELVSELDSLIQCDNPGVRIDVYGGGADESYLRANKCGLQHLGVALLKAGDAPFRDPLSEFAPHTVDTEVKSLFHEESDLRLDWIERTDDLESETHLAATVREQRRTGWFWTTVIFVLIVLVILIIKLIKSGV